MFLRQNDHEKLEITAIIKTIMFWKLHSRNPGLYYFTMYIPRICICTVNAHVIGISVSSLSPYMDMDRHYIPKTTGSP